jgi:transposase InsO family protein
LKYESKFDISMMCRLLHVKRSGYYHYKKSSIAVKARKQQESLALQSAIKQEFIASRRYSGARRIKSKLNSKGLLISRTRITKLMQHIGLKVKTKRKFRPATTDSKHNLPVVPNILNREFKAKAPNQKYVGDITYIATTQGWLYLATVIDLFSKKVVGWSINTHMRTTLVNDALTMAIKSRAPKVGLLWHTDRGVQYVSKEHRALLEKYGITQSMSRKGNCWDNAVAESFFATLKLEYRTNPNLPTQKEAREQIFEYIEVFYNRQRLHSSNGNMSPSEYERAYFEKLQMKQNETEVALCA